MGSESAEFRSRPAGVDNEANRTCKRRVTEDFVKNESIEVQHDRLQGFGFL